MIKIGLTGNIGSGKSTVARIFNVLGIPVYNSDEKAKEFLHTEEVKENLVMKFGPSILNGLEIDRRELANIVFNDKEALDFLNSMIHPLVRKDFEDWCISNNKVPYVIQEAAILFESGFDKLFDKTIVVSCPEEITVDRVMKRDKVSELAVKERMKNQWSQEKKKELSDFIVYNDNEQLLVPQVLKIHKELIS